MISETLRALLREPSRLAAAAIELATTKTLRDEYVAWLRFANAGMLHPGNVYAMDLAIRNLPSDAPVLEIGSFCGLSTNVLTHLLETHNRPNRLVTCDKWIFEGCDDGDGVHLGESSVTHAQYREHVMESFCRNVRLFAANRLPYTIESLSDDFFRSWGNREEARDIFGREITLGGPIAFCYVDGNHTYEYARRDFENVDAVLDVGGYILFDDSARSARCGLDRLMREIELTHRYQLVARNPNYLFKKAAAATSSVH